MTSDINTACRMPLALDILVTGTTPARLPADRHPGPRAPRLVAGSPGEYLFVGIRGGIGALEQPRAVRLDPGDICFYDVDRPPSLDVPASARLKVFRVPREALGLDERALR